MTLSTATPNLLQDPGYLLIAPLASTLPINTVAGSVFTDAWDAAWLSLGATEDGSEFSYNTTITPVNVAEFFDPITYRTTARSGSIAFALANFTLTNYHRALNGGATALTPTAGTGATASYDFSPPTPGSELRVMIGWESLDHTVRLVIPQAVCGGEVKVAMKKAPSISAVPCNFSFELPTTGALAGLPFKMSTAGSARG
jgi:hypothetical protein